MSEGERKKFLQFELLPENTPNLAEHRNVWGSNPVKLRPVGPDEDPTSKLLGAVDFPAHCSMHLEAYRVTRSEELGQHSDGPVEVEEQFSSLADEIGGDGPFEEVTIAGRTYVLVMTPYCE